MQKTPIVSRLVMGLSVFALGLGSLAGCGEQESSEGNDNTHDALQGSAANGPSQIVGTVLCPPTETLCNGACVDTLSDAANCGACGHSCQGGTCQSGACQPVVLASGQKAPTALVVDETDVYWLSINHHGVNNGALLKTAKKGGATAVVLAEQQGVVRSLVKDEANVYWLSMTTGDIQALPLGSGSGAAPKQIVAEKAILGLAVDKSNVYWSNPNEGTVWSAPKTGGEPKSVLTGYTGIMNIVTDANSFYMGSASSGDPSILKVSLDGSKKERIYHLSLKGLDPAAMSDVGRLWVDDKNVYWVGSKSGKVLSMPIGGGKVTLLADQQGTLNDLAVDDKNLYFTDGKGGRVLSLPLGGGAPKTLASGLKQPARLALDNTSVYFTDYGDPAAAIPGAVYKIAK